MDQKVLAGELGAVGLVVASDPSGDNRFEPFEIALPSKLVREAQRVTAECGTDLNGHPLPRDVAYVLERHGIGERRGEAIRSLIALQRSESAKYRKR